MVGRHFIHNIENLVCGFAVSMTGTVYRSIHEKKPRYLLRARKIIQEMTFCPRSVTVSTTPFHGVSVGFKSPRGCQPTTVD